MDISPERTIPLIPESSFNIVKTVLSERANRLPDPAKQELWHEHIRVMEPGKIKTGGAHFEPMTRPDAITLGKIIPESLRAGDGEILGPEILTRMPLRKEPKDLDSPLELTLYPSDEIDKPIQCPDPSLGKRYT
jgi:hypothetical protein